MAAGVASGRGAKPRERTRVRRRRLLPKPSLHLPQTHLRLPLAPTHPPTHPLIAGREGRGEFGARSGLKKKKTGGLSNREKDKRKRLPYAARSGQVQRCGASVGCLIAFIAGRWMELAVGACYMLLTVARDGCPQVKKRLGKNKSKNSKNFKGRVKQ